MGHFGGVMGEGVAFKVVVFAPTENGADEGAHVMVVGFGTEVGRGEGGAEGLKDADEDPDVAMDDGGGEVVAVGIDEVQEVGEEGFAVVAVEVRLGGGWGGFGVDEGFEVRGEMTTELGEEATFVNVEGVIGVAAMEVESGGGNIGGCADVADAEVEAAMSEGGVESGMDGMFVFGVAFVETAAGSGGNWKGGEVEVGHGLGLVEGREAGAPVEVGLKALDFVAVENLGADVGVIIEGAGFLGVGLGGSGDGEGIQRATASGIFVGELNVFGVVLVWFGHVCSS